MITIAAISGFLSVALGAFGAHGLPDHLASRGLEIVSIEKKVANFETGAQYLMYHALAILALGVSGLASSSKGPSKVSCWAAGMFVVGMFLFSGGLFATSFTELKIHAIIPIGGVFYLVGWGMLLCWGCCGGSCRVSDSSGS